MASIFKLGPVIEIDDWKKQALLIYKEVFGAAVGYGFFTDASFHVLCSDGFIHYHFWLKNTIPTVRARAEIGGALIPLGEFRLNNP